MAEYKNIKSDQKSWVQSWDLYFVKCFCWFFAFFCMLSENIVTVSRQIFCWPCSTVCENWKMTFEYFENLFFFESGVHFHNLWSIFCTRSVPPKITEIIRHHSVIFGQKNGAEIVFFRNFNVLENFIFFSKFWKHSLSFLENFILFFDNFKFQFFVQIF